MAEPGKRKVGKYEVIEELGRGAMGVVYKARDPFIGRMVALKTITPGLLDNPELLQRFYREAQAAGSLQHPNIVIIYDLGEAEGLPYIAMEFLEGQSLEKTIAAKPNMPLAQKLNVILQLSRGLDYAHKHGVVHRDIKPGNIIVMRDGTVKVVDFGIVRLSSTSMTSTGMVIGTVGYMSPEQAQGEHVDARSDLFSVGVVMYELFAYRKPFAGSNVAAVLIKIVTEEPPPLAEAAPQVPPQLCEIVHRCLHKNPAERFQSLEDLVLDLEPITRALQRDMVEELVKQGHELLEQKDFAQARDLLRHALKLDSSHGQAKTLMGKVNTELRRLEILPRIEKLLEAGQAMMQEGKFDEAGRKFEEALRLDTQHGPAKELLGAAQQEAARVLRVRQALADSEKALDRGDLTIAQAELNKVLELDASNAQVQQLISKVKDERAEREQRARLQEALRQARTHLIGQRYEECVSLLAGIEKEFRQEAEVQQLLQSAREGLEEQKRRQAIAVRLNEARNLLLDQKHEECVRSLEGAVKEFPDEAEFQRLLQNARESLEQQKRRRAIADRTSQARRLLLNQEYQKCVTLLENAVREFPEEAEFRHLLENARESLQEQQRRQTVNARTSEARKLLGQQKYEECVQLLEPAIQEFPDEENLKNLLESARQGWEQQKRHQTVAIKTDEARRLLGQQEFKKALAVIDEVLKAYPGETAVVKLRQLVLQEEQEFERQQKYQTERARLDELIQKKDYLSALALGEQMQKDFSDQTDITRLLASVRREKQALDRQQELTALAGSIQELFNAKKFDQAIQEAEKGLKKFRSEAALTDLLNKARQAKQEHEKRAELERRVRSIKGAIERGELTDALDLGRQTLTLAPDDTDVTQLLNIAQRETEAREKKRQRDDLLKTALFHMESKDFDQATLVLRNVAREFPFDDQVKTFLKAAETGHVPADAATLIGMPAAPAPAETVGAETQYVMQGPPATAAAPPSPTASTQPQPTPVVQPPPEVKMPPAPAPTVKPAPAPVVTPEVKAPPRPKPEAKPAAAPPVVAPPAEVAVPIWKKPAGMAAGGVLAVALLVGVYFTVSGGGESTTPVEPTVQQPQAVSQLPPAVTAEQQQQALLDEAQRLADARNYQGALAKLDEAQRIQGPLGTRIQQLRTAFNEEVTNEGLQRIRSEESQFFSEAEGHLQANRLDRAEQAFRRVLALPEGGRRRADAQRYLQEVLPRRRQEDNLFSQARSAAQQRNDESRLREADRLLGQVIALNGPRLLQAQQLQATVRQRLDQLGQEASGQQQVAALEGQIRQDLQRENFQAARQKLEQLRRLTDPSRMGGEIERAEQEKFNNLEGEFGRSRRDRNALQRLTTEFRKLEQSGGPLAGRAREYVSSRIPGALNDLEAPAPVPPAPVPTGRVSCTVRPMLRERYDRSVTAGSTMAQKLIDSGVVLTPATNCGLPDALIKATPDGSEISLRVQIDENGRVTGGQALGGDAALGQMVLQAAQRSWQFNPPRVNGIPVKTTATVMVKF